MIKLVREFKGEEDKYVSWRESAEIAMGQYARGSERFFSALSILRNKITGTAKDALTRNGTVLNFDAIVARLDFVFSDKRPIHMIEVLTQGKLTIMEYYGLVNKKLALVINKTFMTYGRNKPLTAEMNEKPKMIIDGYQNSNKNPRQGNRNNYNSNQKNTNNLSFNQPDSQNRNNYNQN